MRLSSLHILGTILFTSVLADITFRGRPFDPNNIDIEAAERAYKQQLKRGRVQKVQGRNSNERSRLNRERDADQSSDLIELLKKGSVNFNAQIEGIVQGDVQVLNEGKHPNRRLSTNTDADTGSPGNSGNSNRNTNPGTSRGRGGPNGRKKRKAINTVFNEVERWTDGVVHWLVEPNIFPNTNAVRRKINDSLTLIEAKTCVKFVEIDPQQTWPSTESLLRVGNSRGACSSFIGRIPNAQQTMSLAPACQVTGTIQHEFLHAIGFGHEHERPDRDDYVNANPQFIPQDFAFNFEKEPAPTYSTNIPYDLTSVMHYSLNQFSSDPTFGNTLEIVDPKLAISALDIGQRVGFSWHDELAVNKFYDCQGTCIDNCQNGGYMRQLDDGTCKCTCPEGLNGADCTEVTSTCGSYVDLGPGQSEAVLSSHETFDGTTKYQTDKVCYYYVHVDEGYMDIEFTHFNVKCDHYLEIRQHQITQTSIGLCGDSEPAPLTTLSSPKPQRLMLIFDTTDSRTPETGWRAIVRKRTDPCVTDPCHGARCEPTPGAGNGYICHFPSHPLHCSFTEGLLRDCDRVRFNKYYQVPGEFQLAWQIETGISKHMITISDFTTEPQRGIASIVPHSFTSGPWCLHFEYRIKADDVGTLNVFIAKNGLMDSTTQVFTVNDDRVSFWTTVNKDIDGSQYSATDLAEIVFEAKFTDRNPAADIFEIDNIHLVPNVCPGRFDPCASFPCNDGVCTNVNNAAVCSYSTDDIHCDFEVAENGCRQHMSYLGKLDRLDDADWTINSGSTPTSDTGPDGAARGVQYLYMESNFPQDPAQRDVRSAYLRLTPRKSAQMCLSFKYHMFGNQIVELSARAVIHSTSLEIRGLWSARRNQGNEWHTATIDVPDFRFNAAVKIVVELVAQGRSKFSDIAIDDLHLVSGDCQRIPVNGTWTNWNQWSICSQSCATGTQTRSRECLGTANGGTTCSGESSQSRDCNTILCAVDGFLTAWGQFSDCSTTCGPGTQSRARECIPPQNAGKPCPTGSLTESQACSVAVCPVDAILSAWAQWSSCTTLCGTGERTRTRSCTPAVAGGIPCSAPLSETQDCNTQVCNTDAVVGDWVEWSECTKACGTGQRTRTRSCTPPSGTGQPCPAELSETQNCNTLTCPADAIIGNWGEWGECTKTCGTGQRTRARSCTPPSGTGQACPAELSQRQDCNTLICPVDAVVDNWVEWSECTKTCGTGQQARTRTCTPPSGTGQACPAELSQIQDCNIQICPVDAVVSSWGGWGECTKTCGTGQQTRTRSCTPPSGTGQACPTDLSQTQDCTRQACETNEWSQWGQWSDCSVTCGTTQGQIVRTRGCQGPGTCIGDASETENCTPVNELCPVDGQWRRWSNWGSCTATCGGGTQTRTRQCSPSQSGGQGCVGENSQSQNCNVDICIRFTEWGPWGDCSHECGDSGLQNRERTEIATGQIDRDARTCNRRICPSWGSWQEWGACTATCGNSARTRTRLCNLETETLKCDGSTMVTENCSVPPCEGVWQPWNVWSTCSKSCGGGTRTRTRVCGTSNCPGLSSGSENCNTQACVLTPSVTTWRQWTQWGSCSSLCDGGTRTRTRICDRAQGGPNCCGLSEERSVCGSDPCGGSGLSGWSDWNPCPTTQCGGFNPRGFQQRTRQCIGASTNCNTGSRFDFQTCIPVCCDDLPSSPEITTRETSRGVDANWGQWGSWSSCSSGCPPQQERSRLCDNPAPSGTGRPCSGQSRETSSSNCGIPASCLEGSTDLPSTGDTLCEGFESTNINGGGFSTRSGPPPKYFPGMIELLDDGETSNARRNTRRVGETGPNYASQGKKYLHFTTDSNSLGVEFSQKVARFDLSGGACITFEYSAYGTSWNGARLALTVNGASVWDERTRDNTHWKKKEVSVSSGRFNTADILLKITKGRGSQSDLGFDNLMIRKQPCNVVSSASCPTVIPATRSCGFESGDDCSWVERIPGDRFEWWVWSGQTSSRSTGPTSAYQGSNYLYAETSGAPTNGIARFKLTNLPDAGTGCLELAYHMFGNAVGRLTVHETVNGQAGAGDEHIFDKQRDQGGDRWFTTSLNVNFNRINTSPSAVKEIIFQYQKGRGSSADVAVDNITYRTGRCESVSQVATWGSWSSWSSCSQSCGLGNQRRTRECTGAVSSSQSCVGSSTDTRPCNLGLCDGGAYQSWNSWSSCSRTCGSGTRTRNRICPTSSCSGSPTQSETCNSQRCLVAATTTRATPTNDVLCEGFETSSITGGGFSVVSGAPPKYLIAPNGRTRVGSTGPNYASEGIKYLHFTTDNTRSGAVFTQKIARFDLSGGACISFEYSAYGTSWRNGRLSLTVNGASVWDERTRDNTHWIKEEVSVSSGRFNTADIFLRITKGRGSQSDLGLDNLMIRKRPCNIASSASCLTDAPSSRSCGFESGDDCSWVVREVPGSSFYWSVWTGPTNSRNTGPSRAHEGLNYLYAEVSGAPSNSLARFKLTNLPITGTGCLRFSYHMFGNGVGRLTVHASVNGRLPGQREIFTELGNKGNEWRTNAINVNFSSISSSPQTREIVFQYQNRQRQSTGDVGIDNIRYSTGSC